MAPVVPGCRGCCSRLAEAAALAEIGAFTRTASMPLTTRQHTLRRPGRLLPLSLLACGLAGLGALPARAETCQFLNPVGGNGVTPIVTKPYSLYKLFFTADSSVSATYPIQAFLKFSGRSNLQVYNSNFPPTPGTGGSIRVAGYPGKLVNQVNIKVGATDNMAATGFTYRISVQGCN